MEPIKLKLSSANEEHLKRSLQQQIRGLETGLQALHETNLPKWRRIYEALPAESARDFPFINASNLIVPLAGIHCDTLKARVMSAIWKTRPLWSCNVVGDFEGEGEVVRDAWQTYLLHNAVEPTELDMYRVESEWIGEIIRYGTSFMKIPFETVWQDFIVPAGDGTQKYEEMREMVYKGPRPEKLPFEDFLISPSARTLEAANLKVHRIRYQKHELLERRYTQFFDAAKVDAIIKNPDRTSPEGVQSQRESDANVRSTYSSGYAEWEVFECWLPWRAENSKKAPRIIVWYHLASNTILNAIYDTYSPFLKCQPFVMGRLLYRDDSLYGYGLCEILEMLQEEVSMIHNQRRDNMTVANTKVWRVSPDSKLHSGYQIYPSAMLPAEKDEIEPMSHGEVSPLSIEEEKLAIDLAERRSGVSPPMQGSGAGTNSKKGVYSAMGTMSLLQEGNSRTDMTIADVRHAHTKVGRIISNLYAHLGIDEGKLEQFGKMAEHIKMAGDLIKKGKMALPINPSTASVNKEIEKQNDLMLVQIMNRHYTMITQLLQQAQTAVLPQEIRDYSIKVIKASDTLMKGILRNFDKDDVDSILPQPSVQPPQQQQQGGQQQPNAQNRPSIVPPQQGQSSTPQPRTSASLEVLQGMVGGAGGQS